MPHFWRFDWVRPWCVRILFAVTQSFWLAVWRPGRLVVESAIISPCRITLDRTLTYKEHLKGTARKISKRNCMMRKIRVRQSTENRYSSRVPEYRQFLEWSRVEYRHVGVLLEYLIILLSGVPEYRQNRYSRSTEKSSTRVVLRSTGKIDTPGVPKKVVLV